jgi:predicted TPR repeat methyltransferase
LLAGGQVDEALAAARASVEKDANSASGWHQLALAHWARGELKEVRKGLLKAVEIDSGFAVGWYHLARLEVSAGQWGIAAGLFRRAIKARPGYVAAYEGLAEALEQGGHGKDAATVREQAGRAARGGVVKTGDVASLPAALDALEKKLTDAKTAGFHYLLAAQVDVFPPSRVPTALVESLFDRYAERFDGLLHGQLEYRVPEMIAEKLAATAPGKWENVLDLGCGTGLCGVLLRPMARLLAGVDLSAGMLERARGRGVYDELQGGDLIEAMRRTGRGWDLLIAADVLIYIGDLSATFEAAAGALRDGGLFVFSVEAGGGERYQFNTETRRFTHSAEYLKNLARMHGLSEEWFDSITVRLEKDRRVAGYLVGLRLDGVG